MLAYSKRRVNKACAMCKRDMSDVPVGQMYCPGCLNDRAEALREDRRLQAIDATAERLESEREIVRKRMALAPKGIRSNAKGCWAVYELWSELDVHGRAARLVVFVDLSILRLIEPWEVEGLVPSNVLQPAVEAYRLAHPVNVDVVAGQRICDQCGRGVVQPRKHVCEECRNANQIVVYQRTIASKRKKRMEVAGLL